MDNSKLFYILNLTELQRNELIKVIKDNPNFNDLVTSISRNNPVTGLQAPLIQKMYRQWLSETLLVPFWFVYNFWKYPR
jgi:TusA-related sulfurtransferase